MALCAAERHRLSGGRARCELLGARGPFQEQRRTKDVCPFLTACHIRVGGPVQGPYRGQGMGGFVPHQPSGERPGEAAHPLLMGAFPPGGCWPVVAGGSRGQRHRCLAPLQRQPWPQHWRVLPHPFCHSSEEPSGSCSLQLAWSLHFTPLVWSG